MMIIISVREQFQTKLPRFFIAAPRSGEPVAACSRDPRGQPPERQGRRRTCGQFAAPAHCRFTQRGARWRLPPWHTRTAARAAGLTIATRIAILARHDLGSTAVASHLAPVPSAPSFGTLSVSHQTSINISMTSASLTTKSSITHE